MKMKYQLMLTVMFGLMSPQLLADEEAEQEPIEIELGEHLFLETRFAQAYYQDNKKADPILKQTITTTGELASPFASKTINCRVCHMVDEHANAPSAGMRSYADYAMRSLIPGRDDGATLTTRNSMSMVNISISRPQGELFHYDGEFNSMEDLVKATLTGRNFGWLVSEENLAIKHIAKIIREDDGKSLSAKELGGSYRQVFKNLPLAYRLEVANASDNDILNAVAKLISAYVTDLAFSRDENDQYSASPYDVFLKKNNISAKPAKTESTEQYNKRLLKSVSEIKSPKFVNNKDGKFSTHKQDFIFAEKELRGMKLFFSKSVAGKSGGNCASCHAAPHFSDFGFHNTGLTQQNYDQLHGPESFDKLEIPTLAKRNKNYNAYLPATAKYPKASSKFRSAMSKNKPGNLDLGLWNIFANTDMPAPQTKLKNIICQQAKKQSSTDCSETSLLPFTIAAFKTPVLRDLGHSNPYMHNGEFNSLNAAVSVYINSSTLARTGLLRNTDLALKKMKLKANDIDPLVAFLKSLNEDYD